MTNAELIAALTAADVLASKSAAEIAAYKVTNNNLVAQATLDHQGMLAAQGDATAAAAKAAAALVALDAASVRSADLLAQIALLQTELADNVVTAEAIAALTVLQAQLAANDALLPDLTPTGTGTGTPPVVVPPVVVPPAVVPPVVIPPTADDAVILAALTDSSVAGMNARLGPVGDPTAQMPDVWTRPEVPTQDMGFAGGASAMGTFSQGLSVMAPPTPVTVPPTPLPNSDFGSDELGFAMASNRPLVVNPSNPAAVNSDGGPGPQGVNVGRLRLEEHTQGMVRIVPAIPWNDPNTIPDELAVTGHTASFGMGNKLGQCIQMVRGRINRYDGGFGLYDKSRGGQAYIGTMPTNTAWSPWAGEQLDDNFIPLCLGVSSQNEFLYVCGHDIPTNTGKMIVIVNWGGHWGDGSKDLPFDFYSPHPGLVQSGVVTGMKIIGTVDLPIKWPTSISIATSRNTGSDRIEGTDGNAAYLRAWNFTLNAWADTYDLTTQVGRDGFLAKNGGWIATWGKIVVASKPENKVVQLDATALYQGYRDQYFTTQAKNDATKPQNPGGQWYQIYNTTDLTVWPYMLPAWVPTVTRVLDIAQPTVAWMLETNDGAFVVAGADGVLRWFKDDGTADGTLQLGANITSIKDDKYAGGVRNGYLTVVSRVARTVYGVKNKLVNWTIQDARLIDPVAAGTGDTHGIEDRSIWVLDYNGKAIRMYRNSKIVTATWGGQTWGTGPTAVADKLAADAAVTAGTTPLPPVEGLEHTGSFTLPDSPFSGADSNVN